MLHRELHQLVRLIGMQVLLPVAHAGWQVSRIDGQVARSARVVPIGADPYRNSAVLPRRLVAATHAFHQHAMRGLDDSLRQRQVAQQALRLVYLPATSATAAASGSVWWPARRRTRAIAADVGPSSGKAPRWYSTGMVVGSQALVDQP